MKPGEKMSGRPPVWFILILVLLTLPLAGVPWVLAAIPEGMDELRLMMRLSPLYVLAADWLAWVCWWPRRLMSWIMVGLILLSHIAVLTMYKESMPLL